MKTNNNKKGAMSNIFTNTVLFSEYFDIIITKRAKMNFSRIFLTIFLMLHTISSKEQNDHRAYAKFCKKDSKSVVLYPTECPGGFYWQPKYLETAQQWDCICLKGG